MKWETENTNRLIESAQKGDENAKKQLIEENTPLVKSLVKRYLSRNGDYDDLFQVGSLGLLKAIDGFDISYNVRFSTYAVPMIAGEIKRYIRDNTSVKMPRSLKEMQQKIRYAREKLAFTLSHEPGACDIAKEIGVPVEDVLFALESMNSCLSLDEPAYDETALSLGDIIEDKKQQTSVIDRLALFQCLDQLEEREKKVIMLRYFKDYTQTHIASMMGISQVQISRIESRTLEKLRRKLG